jgi:hypothetical protein
LALKGMEMIQTLPWWGELDCKTGAILGSLLCLYGLRPRYQSSLSLANTESSLCQRLADQPPVGLYLFGVGVLLAAIQLLATNETETETIPQQEPLIVNALKDVTWNDWTTGWLQGTLPQLPLTTLNSCLSVCLLARTLFPDKPVVTRRSVCLSIGLMNLLLCPLGCMPHCHGAGGLAGQHRLGAQSGVSMVVLGIFKIALSLVAYQGSLLVILDALPVSILGVLLVLAGHELATTGILGVGQETMSIALVTALVIVGTGQTHVGALCGWITYMIHGNGYQELLCCGRGHTERDQERGQYSHLETSASND